MTIEASPLMRYLRQVGELGGPDLFLDTLTADQARDLAAGRARSAGTATTSPGEAVVSPAVLATLQSMAADAATCTRCRLHADRRHAVFGEGSAVADVAVVGEAPGQEEDRTGRPFVGRAGRMLDLLLMSAGWERASVYICNVLKCRPPGNRNPLPDEVDACTGRFLHAQLEAIAPRVILAVGRFAIQALLGTDEAVSRLRGRLHAYRGTPVVVSYHPAYLLRSPQMVRMAWDDFQQLRAVLDEQI